MISALLNFAAELLRTNGALQLRVALAEKRAELADQRAANAEKLADAANQRAAMLEQSLRLTAQSLQQNHTALAQLAVQHAQRERALNRRAS